MRRQVKTYKVKIGNTEFTSNVSITDAKVKANACVEQAFTGSYDPSIMVYRGSTLIIWRIAEDGWTYRILRAQDATEGNLESIRSMHSFSDMDKKEVTTKQALYDFCQCTWTLEDGLGVSSWVTDERDRRELYSWQHWQIRYKHFEKLGNSNPHSAASDYYNYPEPAMPKYEN